MQVRVEDAGACRKLVHIQVDADAVADDYASIVKAYTKASKLPGFRKGKAPQNVVEKQYAKHIAEDAKERLLPRFYHEAIADEGMKVESIVDIKDVVFDKQQGLSFNVTVDVPPEFKLPKYKKISLKEQPVEVTDEDVEEAIGNVLEQFARYEEVEGRAVKEEDLVRVDYQGTCDGQPVLDMVPEKKALAEGTDFWMMLGDGRELLPGINEQVVGAEIGSERDVTISFPDDYTENALAGKTASYVISVKGIREKVQPELNEEMLKRFEVESEEDLRKRFRKDITEAREEGEKNRLKDEIAQHLLGKADFGLPQSMVAEETNTIIRSQIQRMMSAGATRQHLEEHQQQIMAEASRAATDRVKLSYILRAIAEAESIEVDDGEVNSRIEAMAGQYRMSPAQLRGEMEKRDGISKLKDDIQGAKTLDFLLENAKVKR